MLVASPVTHPLYTTQPMFLRFAAWVHYQKLFLDTI